MQTVASDKYVPLFSLTFALASEEARDSTVIC